MKDSKPALLLLVCLVTLTWTSTVSAQVIEIHTGYYTPQYYFDQPIFFDDAGVPFYYANGVVRYVPRSYGSYHALRQHYRSHRSHYRRWYSSRGHRFHGYRRVAYSPLYHNGYTVYYDDVGQPYYWTGSSRSYIPRHHPSYRNYRQHYGRHRVRYRSWHRRQGHRNSRRSAMPARRHNRPHRVASPPSHRPGRRHHPGYGAPPPRRRAAPHRPEPRHHGGRIDCRRNPGHPACRRGESRRGGVRHGGPAPRRDNRQRRSGGDRRRGRHR